MLLVKNTFTYISHRLIGDAIYRYNVYLIRKTKDYHELVFFCEMESYEKTLFRLWDWGYTRILPPEKFELIKPYINRKGERNGSAK